MAWTQEEMEGMYAKARGKAATDPVFRKKLLADPNKTISELSGKAIPAGIKIKVIESDPAYQATFVIPDLVTDEMSDSDLEKVAGGACFIDLGGCGAHGCAANAEASGK